MKKQITRRDMLRSTALAGAGLMIVGSGGLVRGQDSPNEKINVACIGIGGRGSANVGGVSGTGKVNMVAPCDCDDSRAGGAYKKFPSAKKYYDYHKMYDEMEDQIDAVVVSTPDHTHYDPSIRALRMGKHLYCEKPMAHSVGEARGMIDEAKKQGVVTQLGVQRHTLSNMHRVVELIKSGEIGDVTECYTWVGGSRGMPSMPTEFPPVPEGLDWDAWIGPAKMRPYTPALCPYNWRFWWDFGTGEAGNWGCHLLDIPFWALDLKYPTRVSAVEGEPADPQRTPKQMSITFEFPARGAMPAMKQHWMHSTTGPALLAEKGLPHYGSGSLFIGTKGMLVTDFDKHVLAPEDKYKDFEYPEQSIPNSPGFYKEWTNAILGLSKEPPTCNFEYSGPLAETVLLGNVAYRVGKPFDWDAEKLVAVGVPEAEQYIRPEFYNGYKW